MELIQAIILGALQGIFEWLPISSQGQIIAVAVSVFGIEAKKAFSYSVLLHAGTLLAAIVYFRNELKEIFTGKNNSTRNFILIAVLATAITAVPSYLLLKNFLVSSFTVMILVGLMLIVTGLIQRIKTKKSESHMNIQNSVIVGLAQGFSVLPGISRSGITTSALLLKGFSPQQAFRLSFLLSIPSVLLAELAFGFFEGFTIEPMAFIALFSAFGFGLISINLFLRIARKISFSKFCYAFGLFYLSIAVLGGIN